MKFFSRGKKKEGDKDFKLMEDNQFASPNQLGRSAHFEWYAETNVSSISGAEWIRNSAVSYLERVYSTYRDEILQIGEARHLPIRVVVRPSSSCQGGIGGATGSGELSYCAGQWAPNQYCFGIIAHELCNLFTGENVSAGWPTAWWANHRSPFPTVIANRAMKKIVPQFYRSWGDYNDPLVVMFERLYSDFRGMFPRMFQKMRELGISLVGYEEPRLSHVIYYFMFYAAGRQLTNYFVSPPMPPINPAWIMELERRYNLHVI